MVQTDSKALSAGVLSVIMAAIGGVFALQRKAWPMAMIGAICALMWPFTFLGILSIIFVSIGRSQFK